MKSYWRHEGDGWTTAGPKINTPENLEAIREVLEERGPVIVEWRHYRGSSAPDRLIFEDNDKFTQWLTSTNAGDDIWVWAYDALCRDDNPLVHGKSPDEGGEVPTSGAY